MTDINAKPGFRERHHKTIWALIWPIRIWYRHFPINRGKGLILRRLILPCLPPIPIGFPYRLPSGHLVDLHYREDLGNLVLFRGEYEDREIEALCEHVRLGTYVFDVGANIGLSALPISVAVGGSERVLCFEPTPATSERLERNLERNEISNIEIVREAVGNHEGTITFHESSMPTLSSAAVIPRDFVRSYDVPLTTLDRQWAKCGKPRVSAIKVDVEGGELAVLEGASTLLEHEGPAILLEAWTDREREPIDRFLSGFRYRRLQPEGFEERNYLYVRV